MRDYIVGIDPSLTGTAVCVLNAHDGQIQSVATLTTKYFGMQRLRYIRDAAMAIMQGYAIETFSVFIEGYGFGCRGAAVFSLGELGGVLRLALFENTVTYYDVAPTVLKKFITSKGNSHKELMLEQVYRRFSVGSEILKDNNQVDAFGLAQYGKSFLEWRDGKKDFTQIQLETFKKLGDRLDNVED